MHDCRVEAAEKHLDMFDTLVHSQMARLAAKIAHAQAIGSALGF
jgi:hypothetical protein